MTDRNKRHFMRPDMPNKSVLAQGIRGGV